MATERFPKAKYLRQLAAMQYDLEDWKIAYKHAAASHEDDWIGTRFDGRADVLDDAIHQLIALRDTMYGLPRLR